MSALKFCFPSTFYPPYSFGGDGIAIQRLARALVQRGHHVTVIHDVDAFTIVSGGGTPKAVDRDNADDGVEVISLRSSIGRFSPLLAQQTGQPTVHRSTLRDFFAKRKFDVVNFHNGSLIGAPGIFALAKNATRVYSAHEHWLICPTHVLWRHRKEVCPARQCIRCQLRYHRPPQLWRHSWRGNRQFDQIDLYIAMSEFSRLKHAEFGFRREMKVLNPFMPSPDVPSNETSPHHRPYFLFAGRLEEIKGVQTVIPQLGCVPHVDLLIAGEGSYRYELEMMATQRVRFLGSVSETELARYYRHAIATIVPSITYETFGLTLIESFANGTPVIARDLGPFPEIVKACDGGLLFSSDEELATAMRSLATDHALARRMSVNAMRGHKTLWSEEAIVPRYLEMVQQARTGRT